MVRVLVALAVLAAVPAAAATEPCTEPGCEVWVARYDGPAGGSDRMKAVEASPDGSRVYLTGYVRVAQQFRWGTVALDAATGERLWAAILQDTLGTDFPEDVAVSPDGSRVVVTGRTSHYDGGVNQDLTVVAYAAGTGDLLWRETYDGPTAGPDGGFAAVFSPDGSRVFVTGNSNGTTSTGTSTDYVTIAHDAATGERIWATRYEDPVEFADNPVAIGISPAGDRVFVTGFSSGVVTNFDYVTVAYDAASGVERWVARYDGPTHGDDRAVDLAVTPQAVLVTGTSDGGATSSDYLTVAYDSATGQERWTARFGHLEDRADTASALALSPDGSRAYVAGRSARNEDVRVDGTAAGWDSEVGLVAYDTEGGAELWSTLEEGGGDDGGVDLAVSGGVVHVAGWSDGPEGDVDFLTTAHAASTGQALWSRRYDGPAGENDRPVEIALVPGLLVVAGDSRSAAAEDLTAVAYRIGPPPPDPQVVDPAGDANGLGELAPPEDRRPLSADPADLLWARLETSYVAVPVGEDGIDYVPTGLVVHLGAAAPPRADGPTIEYKLRTSLGGCSSQLVYTLRGSAALPTDRPDGQVSWIQLSGSCPDGIGVVTRLGWSGEVRALGREAVIEIPFGSLTEAQGQFLAPGRVMEGPEASTETPAAGVVQVGQILPGRIDHTATGADWVIGSDVPPNVPCTRGCP